MLKVLVGDMFRSQAQTWVNTVNCVGVMGKGVALEFRKMFPEMYEDYVVRCRRGEVRLGRPYLYKPLLPPWILNFPTKEHWRSVASIESIVEGLEYLTKRYREWGITSLAVPPLGCGQGQLEWRIVGPTLYRHLDRMGIPVELYAPYGTPHEELRPEFLGRGAERTGEGTMPEPEWVQPGWVVLVEILRQIEEQPYHWPVGRTAFQKIAYVATDEGIPTGLEYRRGSFGPFAPAMKGAVARLLSNGLVIEERLGRMFAVRVGPTFADARLAYASQIASHETTIEKIADLFVRMNTDQAEMAATVLFASRSLSAHGGQEPSERDVLQEVLNWKQRRRPPLAEATVAETIRNLAALGWLRVQPSADLPVPDEDAALA